MWRSTIAKDLAPLPIIERGFGGSTSEELRYYLGRIVLPYDPRAVVICEGENDYGRGYTPQQIADIQADIIAKIRKQRASTAIALIALKPSPARMSKWPEFKQTNTLLKSVCSKVGNCLFIDTQKVLLDSNGQPKTALYRDDRIHLNADGYKAWTGVIRPALTNFLNKPRPPGELHVDDEG
jgi:lysophospholipase L1-like esterase